MDHSRPKLDTWDVFATKLAEMDSTVRENDRLNGAKGSVQLELGDARELPCADDSVDLVVSHPPYLGAIDYSNMYRLENAVLGLDSQAFKSRDLSTTSKQKYLAGMRIVFDEMHRVLKPGKRMAVVIGDNRKDGFIQPTFAHFIVDAEQRLGMALEDIFIWVTSSKAGMSVKRHGNYIDHNYVLVFKK